MNGIIKSMIFNGLKARFPNFKHLLIYVNEKRAVINYDDDTTKNINIGTTEEKYFTMLAESKDLKRIDSIFVSCEKDCIVIKGDKDVLL